MNHNRQDIMHISDCWCFTVCITLLLLEIVTSVVLATSSADTASDSFQEYNFWLLKYKSSSDEDEKEETMPILPEGPLMGMCINQCELADQLAAVL